MIASIVNTLLALLLLIPSLSFADNHVYLELDCSTKLLSGAELGEKRVLVLKYLPQDGSEWVDELPFTGVVYFNNELYLAEVKEEKITMKVYLDENGEKTDNDEDKLKEMVVIDRYEGTIASIWFNDDGSVDRSLSFGGQCKKRALKKKF